MEASVAATPSQGAPPAATQPPASGQGGASPESTAAGKGSDFNWGLFPNVPENQRELLQPHLRDVLGHVTRMEQQYAPYKGLMEAVTPDQVQNLTTFLANYSQDPLATWLGLAQSLQEDGTIQNPQFSIEQLQSLLAGDQGLGGGAQPGMEDMPPWAQQMAQQMQQVGQWIESQQTAEQERAAQEEERQQAQLLTEANAQIKEQLKATGIPEGLVTDEQIVAALIAYKGDIPQVVASFSGLRDGFLRGFTEQNGSGSRAPTVNGETPQAPQGGLRPRKGDGFRDATIGAQNALAMAARATEQGG